MLLPFLLTGCGTSEKSNLFDENSQTEGAIIEVTGDYSYYQTTDALAGPYRETAVNRVCFKPAQMENINNGQLFCFSNTQEVVDILNIKEASDDCKKYRGIAKVKIKNLSNKITDYSKTDTCVKNGNCEFNEAELVEVIKFYENTP